MRRKSGEEENEDVTPQQASSYNRRRARFHVINPYQYERRTMPPSHASRAFPSQQCFKMKKMERRMLEALTEGGSRLRGCTWSWMASHKYSANTRSRSLVT